MAEQYRKNIALSKEQKQWLDEHFIDVTKLCREKIQQFIDIIEGDKVEIILSTKQVTEIYLWHSAYSSEKNTPDYGEDILDQLKQGCKEH